MNTLDNIQINVEKEQENREVDEIITENTDDLEYSQSHLTEKIDNCLNIVKNTFNGYNTNAYIINKINNYILNLPILIEKTLKEQDDKIKYREKMNEEKEYFISKFLQSHNYSYCQNTELFFNYDGTHFTIINEDEIQYQILSSITYGQKLMTMKHKIKSNIIKQIRENSPISYMPDSATIQFVINQIYPSLFRDKDSAKYFLTIIGDSILKKNENLIYIIPPDVKSICNEIFNQAYNLLGLSHLFNSIKYKYYDHSYSECRLIMINTNTNKYVIDKIFYKYILDFLCVACHYSNRYQNADNFLKNCSNGLLVEHALYLKDNNLENITDNFIKVSLETCNNSSVKWKNILYLWKMYLDKLSIPNIAFSSKLKQLLIQKLEYNESQDIFLNITSPHLPIVSSFLKFWEESITINDEDDCEYELEIGEICTLFKMWCGKNVYINEKTIIDLLQHFYPDIQIEDEKYINQISCNLWDKKMDIINIIEKYKLVKKEAQYLYPDNINNLCMYYYTSLKNKSLIASKKYVEKFIIDYIGEYIDNNNLIMPTLWNNH
jgi:hypothetical protein